MYLCVCICKCYVIFIYIVSGSTYVVFETCGYIWFFWPAGSHSLSGRYHVLFFLPLVQAEAVRSILLFRQCYAPLHDLATLVGVCSQVSGCYQTTYAVLSEVHTLLSKYHRELFLPCAPGFPFGHGQAAPRTHLSSFPQPGRLRVTGREPIPAPPPCRGHSLFLGYTLPSLQTCSNWSWPKLPSVALRFFLGPELADLMATTCSGRHTCGPSHTWTVAKASEELDC